MDTKSVDALLAQNPTFAGMSPAMIGTVAGCAANVRFDQGQFLFHEGDSASRFFVVRTGLVAIDLFVPHKGALTIKTLKEHDVVGWSWLIPPYRWHFDARAIENTRAIAFDALCLRTKCEEDTALGYELMKRFAQIIAGRIEANRVQLMDVYGNAGKR